MDEIRSVLAEVDSSSQRSFILARLSPAEESILSTVAVTTVDVTVQFLRMVLCLNIFFIGPCFLLRKENSHRYNDGKEQRWLFKYAAVIIKFAVVR